MLIFRDIIEKTGGKIRCKNVHHFEKKFQIKPPFISKFQVLIGQSRIAANSGNSRKIRGSFFKNTYFLPIKQAKTATKTVTLYVNFIHLKSKDYQPFSTQ